MLVTILSNQLKSVDNVPDAVMLLLVLCQAGKFQMRLGTHSLRMVDDMSAPEDRWLSVEEICKHLGVSRDTVYKWIEKHAMPAHRMGRLWKFQKDEVDAWVKAGGAEGFKSENPRSSEI